MGNYLKIAAIAVVTALGVALGGCASCARAQKSWESNVSGGLERRVTLYSTTGEVIDAWEGKIDLSQSEDEVLFDLDGKRTVIHGGITVIQEL
jgi:hypothetical protein